MRVMNSPKIPSCDIAQGKCWLIFWGEMMVKIARCSGFGGIDGRTYVFADSLSTEPLGMLCDERPGYVHWFKPVVLGVSYFYKFALHPSILYKLKPEFFRKG